MTDRIIKIFDEFTRHLRFLHFTLVISCVALISILLSDRQSTISLADEQINDIYSYTLESNWREDGIQQYLDRRLNNQSFSTDLIELIHGEWNTYTIKTEKHGSAYFDFLYRSRYFKGLSNSDYINFGGSVSRPKTLKDFKDYFNTITAPDGVYIVEGLGNPIIYYEGDKQNNPVDENLFEYEIPKKDFSLRPSKTKNLNDENDYGARMDGSGTLVLHRADVSSDNMGNVNEEFSGYSIPFTLRKETYRPIEYVIQSSTFHKAENWIYSSFNEQFKALNEVTKEWDDISIETAKKIINSEYSRSGDSFKVIGLELPSKFVLSWGLYIILGIHLYFYLHFQAFLRRDEFLSQMKSSLTLPWLFLYPGKLCLIIFYSTVVVLPVATAALVIYINRSIYPLEETLKYGHVITSAIAIVIVSFLIGRECHRINYLLAG